MIALAYALMLSVLFAHPLKLPPGGRLWTLLPLVFCVAAVYRATRARSAAELPWPTSKTAVSILAGMFLIAITLYIAHEVVLRMS